MKRTSLEAAAYLIWARFGLRQKALAEVRRKWGGGPVTPASQSSEVILQQAVELGKTTMYIARRLPFHCTCLVQSLALTAMLRRRGIEADLKFGVRQGGEGAGGIDAHAWVEYDDQVVLDSAAHGAFVPFNKPD